MSNHSFAPKVLPSVRALGALALSIAAFLIADQSAGASTFYVGNTGTGSITGLDVPASGVPAQVAAATTAATTAKTVNVSPDGRSLFAASYTAETLSAWSVGADRSLALFPGSPLAGPSSPTQSAVAPNGKTIYVSSASNDVGVTAFRINADGSLTQIDNDFTNLNGTSVTITPDGRYVYACSNDGIYDFVVQPDGSLEPLGGAAKVAGVNGCFGAAVTPDGRNFLYGNPDAAYTGPATITSMAIGADGSLTAINGAAVGTMPTDISVSPNGRTAVTFNSGFGGASTPSVSTLAIAADGSITHINTFIIGAAGVFGGGGAISPDGQFFYAMLKAGGNNIRGFALAANGSFTELPGSPYASGASLNSNSSQSLAFVPSQGPAAKIAITGKGATRTFSAEGTVDPDSAIGSYEWNFGDGATATTTTPTTTHKFTKPGLFSASVRATGSDGCGLSQIFTGRTTLCNPGTAASTTVDALPPSITKLKISRSKFKVNKKAKTPKAAKVAVGATLSYKLSEAGTVSLQVQKPGKGKRVGKSCVKPSRSNKKRKSCTRYVNVGKALKLPAKAGNRKTPFSGKVGSRSLAPGSYRVSLTATDTFGNVSAARTVKFKIVR